MNGTLRHNLIKVLSKKNESVPSTVAWMVDWEESERGWGTRPDGASLHATKESHQEYIKRYWDELPDETPNEYERPVSYESKEVMVSKPLMKLLITLHKRDIHGIRLYRPSLFEAIQDQHIKVP